VSDTDTQLVHVLAYLLSTAAGIVSAGVAMGILVLAMCGRFRK
jgi:hypothetical protein